MAAGRFHGLTISVEQHPAADALYVRLSEADEEPRTNVAFIGALRSRNFSEDANKQFEYWEICKTSQGVFLLYQAPRQKWLTHAKSNLETFFHKTGIDPGLAWGLKAFMVSYF